MFGAAINTVIVTISNVYSRLISKLLIKIVNVLKMSQTFNIYCNIMNEKLQMDKKLT